MRASEFAWFNGGIVPRHRADPSVASNTLHLGVAVFDGMMAYWNDDHWYLHRGHEHLERFRTGAARMDLALPWSVGEMLDGIHRLLATVTPGTQYVRPIAYRTAPEVFFAVAEESTSACIFTVPVSRDDDRSMSCQLSPVRRLAHQSIPATWKVSGAYANSYLAERAARAAGVDTGIMLDTEGRVAEASTANLFFVSGAGLVTPALNGDIFPGITRRLVIEIAEAVGIDVDEREVWPDELGGFDAAFLCGTLSELRPIDRIDQLRYDSTENPVFRQVRKGFRAITHQ